MNFDELLEQIKFDYLNPDKKPDVNGHRRLADLQRKYNLSSMKVQKLLVTAGVYQPVKKNSSYFAIKRLYEAGRSVDEIMKELGLSKAVVNASIPYERGAKGLDKLGVDISGDAARKRKQRNKEEEKMENAMTRLTTDLSDQSFCKALQEHERITFVTDDGQRFFINALFLVSGSGKSKGTLYITLVDAAGQLGEKIHLFQDEVLDEFHQALELKAEGKDISSEELGEYGRFILPILVFFGIVDGNKNDVTTRRNIRSDKYCSCCGRIGAPLYSVSSFADLVVLEEEFRNEWRSSWTEEQRKNAEFVEKFMIEERANYKAKVERAKESKAVKAFDAEGTRQFCQLCAQTIYAALADGDVPYVGTKVNVRDLPADTAKKFCDDQLVNTGEKWADRYGQEYEDLYKAVDAEGVEHYFALLYHKTGALIGFDAVEVHRLTRAGKRAASNTDTDYEFHHLIELVEDDDDEQKIYAGLIELMDEVNAGLQNPTIEGGNLATTGTIIPTYVGGVEEYGFTIDGKIYSGEQLARMARGIEGWQIQFQVKDPTDDVLRANEYLMPLGLGEKELVNDTLRLIRLFTEEGCFISDHDKENFKYLFERNVLPKLKLYHESNPRGYGKLAGMAMIRALGLFEGTEYDQEMVRKIIR